MGEDIQASFPFAPEDARFVGTTRRTSTFPQGSLSFMSFVNAQLTDVGREGDWSEIVYDLVPDPSAPTLWQLMRRVYFGSEAARDVRQGEQDAQVVPLLSRVQGLRFRFFDGHTWSEDWGRDRTKARIPQAVEVELALALAETSGRQHTEPFASAVFSTLVDLPLAQPNGAEGSRGGSS
jgi:hypothetical protein